MFIIHIFMCGFKALDGLLMYHPGQRYRFDYRRAMLLEEGFKIPTTSQLNVVWNTLCEMYPENKLKQTDW